MDLLKLLDDTIIKSPDEVRRYIGASGIGHVCHRKIWNDFHGIQGATLQSKTKRIFEIGHRLEEMVKDYIEQSGIKIIRPSKENDFLFFQESEIPEFQGHADGIFFLIENKRILLEIKTAKDSEYNKFVKLLNYDNAVLNWKPEYYSQVQSYMGMSKDINMSYFIVVNKNTAEWSAEWIGFNEIEYELLKDKAISIKESDIAPPKINKNPCYFVCQYCKYKDNCHKPES